MERNYTIVTLRIFFKWISESAGKLIHISLEVTRRLQMDTVVATTIATNRLGCRIVHTICPHRLLFQTTAFVPKLEHILRRLIFIDTRTERITIILLVYAVCTIFTGNNIFRPLLTISIMILTNPHLGIQIKTNQQTGCRSLCPTSETFFFRQCRDTFFQFRLNEIINLFCCTLRHDFIRSLLFRSDWNLTVKIQQKHVVPSPQYT